MVCMVRLRKIFTVPHSMTDRVIEQLARMEMREPNAHLRDDYRQARLIMIYARDHNPMPVVQASYELFGVHPDCVWQRISAMQKAVLKEEHDQWFDESGNLRPQFLDVPDFDASLGQPPLLARLPEHSKKRWTPKAPLRRVLKVFEIHDGSVMYHLEQLQCGHTHTEFLCANPGKKRRRCQDCAMQRPPEDMATVLEALNATVVEKSGIRRSASWHGNLYTMPSPTRRAERESLRILPA